MTIDTMKFVIESCHCEYAGIQKCSGFPDLVLFTVPQTHSTLAVDINNVTVQAIQQSIRKHLKRCKEMA